MHGIGPTGVDELLLAELRNVSSCGSACRTASRSASTMDLSTK